MHGDGIAMTRAQTLSLAEEMNRCLLLTEEHWKGISGGEVEKLQEYFYRGVI